MDELPPLIDFSGIAGLMRRTLNFVDPRLTDHGARVATLVLQLLQGKGGYSPAQCWQAAFVAFIHDIGAYKTEEISHLLAFESKDEMAHTIYGYLFVEHFSPVAGLARSVLFHHTSWQDLKRQPDAAEFPLVLAQLIHLADRADIFFTDPHSTPQDFDAYLSRTVGTLYSAEMVALFRRVRPPLPAAPMAVLPQDGAPRFEDVGMPYVIMLVLSIDFRSTFTVTHTMTTCIISVALARLMGFSRREEAEVTYGALLHDLGKIGIPVSILESPGALDANEMAIMQQHVHLTSQILGDTVVPAVREIALRHHEKLDGSGYPRGLHGDVLTTAQRIVAVADIISALSSRRSYKEAYDPQRIHVILSGMSAQGLLDADMIALALDHLDEILAEALQRCAPLLVAYRDIAEEYRALCDKGAALMRDAK